MNKTILLALAATIAAPANALTSAEKRMVATVDAGQAASVALLERLVNQNSGTMNLDGVSKVGVAMRAELDALGFVCSWVPMTLTGRAGHLIATHRGKAGHKRLLLIGHLDTVFELDSPFQKFVRDGDSATGPGVGDDKGGMVVMLAALAAMKAAGTLAAANIEIVLTGDEENSGDPVEISRNDLIKAGKRADAALDFEGLVRENGRDMGSISRRSSNSWVLKTSGKSGHSSRIFSDEAGNGAIFELTRILHAFRAELPEENLTFNIGLISGGATAEIAADGAHASATGKTNIIPAVGLASGDFRTLSDEQTARVRAKMTAIVEQHLQGSSASIAFDAGYPPMAPTPGNQALLVRLNRINQDLGLVQMATLDPLKRGAGDISFVARDVDGLIGLGPYSFGDHAPGETVDLASISTQAKRAALLMSRLSAEVIAP